MGSYFTISIFLTMFLFILEESVALPKIFRGRVKGGMLGAPPGPVNEPLPPDMWFEQTLDHFDDAITKTWKQRYFVNDKYYKPGGPVFLMIGGEGTANPIWMVTGHWVDLAKKVNALCFQLEHRYYGKSHPTADLSTENLQHLASEQALADLATFRNAMATSMKLTDAKWIAFGGSYPGSLAAWVRLKYPHLFHASIATSAPLLAELDFKEYFGVVKDSLDTTGPQCNPAIQDATNVINEMIQSPSGREQLKKLFKLCDDLDINNKPDVMNFFSTLAGNFAGVVQYNKDNREFEGAVAANITINTLCDIMTDQTRGQPLQRYADVNSLLMSAYKMKCQDFKYNSMIKELQQTSWASSASEGGRQWTYQTCTEFGFYQSSDLQNQPFGHMFPVSFSTQMCTDIFGKNFTSASNIKGITWTNTNYGALGIKVSRVAFPNGSIDPWHALGVITDLGPEAVAIFIKGTAHCANMYPPTSKDPPQLVQARQMIDKLVMAWLKESS